MPKLNKDIREEILTGLLRHAFLKRYEEREQRMARLAQDAYEEALDIPARRLIESLPAGWLDERDRFTVYFGGQSATLYFDGSLVSVIPRRYRGGGIEASLPNFSLAGCLARGSSRKAVPNRRFPRNMLQGENLSLDANHELSQEWLSFTSSLSTFMEEVDTAAVKSWAALQTVTTPEKLLKEWPEVGPYIPARAWQLNSPRSLPTIRTEDLNKSLRLP